MPVLLPILPFLAKVKNPRYTCIIQQRVIESHEITHRYIQSLRRDDLLNLPIPVHLLALFLLIICPLFLHLCLLGKGSKLDTAPVDARMQELARVLVPTSSFWPAHWSQLVLSSSRLKCFHLDLDMILEDVLADRIHLRSSLSTAELLRGPIALRTCTIMLGVKVEKQLNTWVKQRLWKVESSFTHIGRAKTVRIHSHRS